MSTINRLTLEQMIRQERDKIENYGIEFVPTYKTFLQIIKQFMTNVSYESKDNFLTQFINMSIRNNLKSNILYYYEMNNEICVVFERTFMCCDDQDLHTCQNCLNTIINNFIEIIVWMSLCNKSRQVLNILQNTILQMDFNGYGETKSMLQWSATYTFTISKRIWDRYRYFCYKYKLWHCQFKRKKCYVSTVCGGVSEYILNDQSIFLTYLGNKWEKSFLM